MRNTGLSARWRYRFDERRGFCRGPLQLVAREGAEGQQPQDLRLDENVRGGGRDLQQLRESEGRKMERKGSDDARARSRAVDRREKDRFYTDIDTYLQHDIHSKHCMRFESLGCARSVIHR